MKFAGGRKITWYQKIREELSSVQRHMQRLFWKLPNLNLLGSNEFQNTLNGCSFQTGNCQGSDTGPIQCKFSANAVPLQWKCSAYAVTMQRQCRANVGPMQGQCSANEVPMQCLCRDIAGPIINLMVKRREKNLGNTGDRGNKPKKGNTGDRGNKQKNANTDI